MSLLDIKRFYASSHLILNGILNGTILPWYIAQVLYYNNTDSE